MSTSQSDFKDYFSRQSAVYRQARPGYPDELFSWLYSLVPSAEAVWDCATGNGQAAVSLAKYFPRVIATDASEEQISNAVPHERISYRVALAEESGLPDSSVDLITIATALHWFDFDAFYREVNRVLKPGGVLAAWTYKDTSVDPGVNAVVERLSDEVLKGYWPKEIRYVANRYNDLPFPFPTIDPPAFRCSMHWTLDQLVAYFMSWSSTQNYIAANNSNPLDIVLPDLKKAWGNPDDIREVTWELVLKAGRKA